MVKNLLNRLFFILAAFLILLIAFINLPYYKSIILSNYRYQLFESLKQSIISDEFSPDFYWQFRERFSPGTFIRDEQNTGFFSTFRITTVNEGLTNLFYYESPNLQSVDGVISLQNVDDATSDLPATAFEKIKENYPGEIMKETNDLVLIKISDNEYVFSFVESIDDMKRVVGLFDYLPDEVELLNNKQWYNTTYLRVN